ncbi:hypothetical protein HMPREF9552_00194, partial [Escherichia coli MS 198-1]
PDKAFTPHPAFSANARCDADASYLAYKGLTCRFLASGNIAYQH